MPFPVTKRIVYKKNPLVEVICQFRFPPILSIDTEIPAKFQEAIKSDYPLFKENAEILVRFPNIPNSIDGALAEKLELSPASINRKNYEFLSSDENWKINLTREFLALSTKNYHRWEEFRSYLEKAFKPFLEIYSPLYFSRIGLRYKDIINRSELNLGDTAWSDLLKPYILGILTDTVVGPNISGITNVTEIKLNDEQSKVRITSGLVEEAQTKEKAFMIDSDFFTEQKTTIEESLAKLDFFNQRGNRLIQWCITEKLHIAMEPENI
jgi:uncharacterized protein (TIGR04255 family)